MAKRMSREAEKIGVGRAPPEAPTSDNAGAPDGALPRDHDIKTHSVALNALQAKSAEIRGQIGARVKQAEDDFNIHRAAMKLASRLERSDPTKRAEFLRHFDHYRGALNLDAQAELFDA